MCSLHLVQTETCLWGMLFLEGHGSSSRTYAHIHSDMSCPGCYVDS